MSRYDVVDLSALAPPDVVEALDYEAILAAMMLDLTTLDPDLAATVLESDPARKVLEVAAYREMLIRQRVNDASRAVMLASAAGADLDHLAALFHVARALITPADPDAVPPVEAVWESDDRLRRRAQLALEGLSVAGPIGAYEFHALGASPLVADVDIDSPAPTEVVVTVLSAEGDGVPDPALLDLVTVALSAEDVRPLTDQVTVQGAVPVAYDVAATLDVYAGPDAEVVRAASEASVTAFCAVQRRLGEPVTIDGLHKALRVEGVRKVTLTTPAADVVTTGAEVPVVETITVGLGGA